MCRIWRMYCVTTEKLKGRDEDTPGYNTGTLGKYSTRICQLDTLYKSIVLYGGVTVLLFILSSQVPWKRRWKSRVAQFCRPKPWRTLLCGAVTLSLSTLPVVLKPLHRLLVNNQLDALFSMYLFISLLYIFGTTQCSSSAESIVSIHHLVYITLCRWPSIMQIRKSSSLTCITDGHLHRVIYTRWCIDTIYSPDDEHWVARNM
jgi:hypothetical protein